MVRRQQSQCDLVRFLRGRLFFVVSDVADSTVYSDSPHQESSDKDIGEKKNRAYVTVSDAGISAPIGSTAPTMQVTITNTGQTPAFELSWRARFWIKAFPPPDDDFSFDNFKTASKTTLATGQSQHYQWTFDKWDQSWGVLVNTGKAAVYAVGEINYIDVFGKSHFTKFRLYHGGDSLAPPGKFAAATDGNEAN
jgi:hypothetical protein